MEFDGADALATSLARHDVKIVLAESCTAGLAAARLASVPGISKFFCGSFVTYRIRSKAEWLDIPLALVEQHTAESPQVTLAMASAALHRTPEAQMAAAITGHLGPHAPESLDGQIFIAVVWRLPDGTVGQEESEHRLVASARVARQEEAADWLLLRAHRCLVRFDRAGRGDSTT